MRRSFPKCVASIIYPVVAGAVVFVVLYKLNIESIKLLRLEFVLNAIITCVATFTGFVLTAVSILIGASSSKIMYEIGRKGLLPELQCRYIENLILGLIVIFFFIFLGATADKDGNISKNVVAWGGALLVTYILSFISTGYYLLSIMGKIQVTTDEIDNTPSVPDGEFNKR